MIVSFKEDNDWRRNKPSGAIVSSLFPEVYRDRLMAAQNNKSNNYGAVSEESPQINNGADGIGGESCTALGQVPRMYRLFRGNCWLYTLVGNAKARAGFLFTRRNIYCDR